MFSLVSTRSSHAYARPERPLAGSAIALFAPRGSSCPGVQATVAPRARTSAQHPHPRHLAEPDVAAVNRGVVVVWGVRVPAVPAHCRRAHFWPPRAVVLAEPVPGTAASSCGTLGQKCVYTSYTCPGGFQMSYPPDLALTSARPAGSGATGNPSPRITVIRRMSRRCRPASPASRPRPRPRVRLQARHRGVDLPPRPGTCRDRLDPTRRT